MTGISIKMNGEENTQIALPDKFVDNLPLPDNLDYTDLNDDKSDKDFELFKCSKILLLLSLLLILFLKE